MARFIALFTPTPEQTILDVGGSPYNWELVDVRGPICLLNIDPSIAPPKSANITCVVGDGTRLAYADGSFDIVFSNSVIEHVGSLEQQRRFASEVMRVGKRLFVQTPAKSFWLEPHYLTPFVHFLPRAWQKRMLRNFSLWGWITRPSQDYIDRFVDQTRLLGHDELADLFPGCMISKERFLFMTKSFVVTRIAAHATASVA